MKLQIKAAERNAVLMTVTENWQPRQQIQVRASMSLPVTAQALFDLIQRGLVEGQGDPSSREFRLTDTGKMTARKLWLKAA